MWLNGNKRQIFDFLAQSNCPTLGTSTVENARQTPGGGGGMGTHGIDRDIMHLSMLIPGGKGAGNGWGFNRELYPHRRAFVKYFLPGCGRFAL